LRPLFASSVVRGHFSALRYGTVTVVTLTITQRPSRNSIVVVVDVQVFDETLQLVTRVVLVSPSFAAWAEAAVPDRTHSRTAPNMVFMDVAPAM
jgi:hypothetical protein